MVLPTPGVYPTLYIPGYTTVRHPAILRCTSVLPRDRLTALTRAVVERTVSDEASYRHRLLPTPVSLCWSLLKREGPMLRRVPCITLGLGECCADRSSSSTPVSLLVDAVRTSLISHFLSVMRRSGGPVRGLWPACSSVLRTRFTGRQ